MQDKCNSSFRQGFCRAPGCGVIFFVCQHCDRGQAYCSSACRKHARLLQNRQSNRRHQQSEEGRLDHRDRQRAYRLRRASINVTDHTYKKLSAYATMAQPFSSPLKRSSITAFVAAPLRARQMVAGVHSRLEAPRGLTPADAEIVCSFCGRGGRFINPFRERK